MTWILFKSSVKRIWAWLKHYWQVPFIIAWTIVVYIFSRRNSDAIIEVLHAKHDSYKKQIEVLRDSHNNEILKREELYKKYENTIKEIENNFKEKQKKLTKKQKDDIKKVVIKSKGNSDEIKKRIQEQFGFTYVE
tara:strand:- start:83 stop:487 length:405 start_codon:yes stop_codon:yes gene_type:complete